MQMDLNNPRYCFGSAKGFREYNLWHTWEGNNASSYILWSRPTWQGDWFFNNESKRDTVVRVVPGIAIHFCNSLIFGVKVCTQTKRFHVKTLGNISCTIPPFFIDFGQMSGLSWMNFLPRYGFLLGSCIFYIHWLFEMKVT